HPPKTWLWFSAGFTALAVALLFSGLVPVGVPGQWVIKQSIQLSWEGLLVSLGAMGLIVLLMAAAWQKIESARLGEEVAATAALVLMLFMMQFAVGSMSRFGSQESFIAITTRTTNVYFEESGTISEADPDGDSGLAAYLGKYARRSAESQYWQLKTHPPGPVIFFYGARLAAGVPAVRNAVLSGVRSLIPGEVYWRNNEELSFLSLRLDDEAEAAGWLSLIALRLAAALSVVPLYLLARKLAARRTALSAAALAGLTPSLLLFNGTIDQLYPLIGLAAVLIGWHAAVRRSMLLNVLCGIVLWIGLMFSVAFVVFALLICMLQAWVLILKPPAGELRKNLPFLIRMTECMLIPSIVGFTVVAAAAGYGITAWLRCFKANSLFNQFEGRTYLAWLLANPPMFLSFLGLPAAALLVRRVLAEGGRLLEERSPKALDPLAVCTVALLAALWLYGANRGEVERLWMPLMPLCVLAGVGRIELDRTTALALIGVQGAQAVLFKIGLDPLLGALT
ncbi:MAG TPA: hypothetical protein VM141_03370, partial [Planctomycetota bacterium]|nr:hypothetical protein [Planctomycetota bacterium]